MCQIAINIEHKGYLKKKMQKQNEDHIPNWRPKQLTGSHAEENEFVITEPQSSHW